MPYRRRGSFWSAGSRFSAAPYASRMPNLRDNIRAWSDLAALGEPSINLLHPDDVGVQELDGLGNALEVQPAVPIDAVMNVERHRPHGSIQPLKPTPRVTYRRKSDMLAAAYIEDEAPRLVGGSRAAKVRDGLAHGTATPVTQARPAAIGPVVLIALVAVAGTAGVVAVAQDDSSPDAEATGSGSETTDCETTLRIVTARSFDPVLSELAPSVGTGENCANLEVEVVDGRAAPAQVAELAAHVWIPDDAAWAETAGSLELAEEEVAGAGTVVATSPIYMVTDEATAEKVAQAGSAAWTRRSGDQRFEVNLVVRDPPARRRLDRDRVGREAVWQDDGMDASAVTLATALPTTNTVANQALPEEPGDVGLVCEYALTRLLENPNREAAAGVRNAVLLTGSDYTAELRYTWLPTAAAAADPALAGPLERLLTALTDAEADDARRRGPAPSGRTAPPGPTAELMPEISAAPFEVLSGHAVDHVFATWYEADRQSSILVVVDVSGSMSDQRAPLSSMSLPTVFPRWPTRCRMARIWRCGSSRPCSTRRGTDAGGARSVGRGAARPGRGCGRRARRWGLGNRTLRLDPRRISRCTGGLSQRRSNHVIVFTDGKNEDDLETITIEQLTQQLVAAQDPGGPWR